MRRRPPELASWQARALARTLDGLGAIAAFGLVMIALCKGLRVDAGMSGARGADRGTAWWQRQLQRPTYVWALRGVDLAIRLARHGRPTPGQRIARVHLVEVGSGRAPGVRATVIAWVARQSAEEASRRLMRRMPRGDPAAQRQAAQRLAALHRDAEADPEALKAAHAQSARLAQRACLPVIGVGLANAAVRALVAARSPRHQTLEQRLAGTMLVRD